jgi:cytochrome P450
LSVKMTDMISDPTSAQTNGCPVDHNARKTARSEVSITPRLSMDKNGLWHARGHDEVRAILRSDQTKQAGFGAELVAKMPTNMRAPVVHLEGEVHHDLRRKTARFFTPNYTNAKYRPMMEKLCDQLVTDLAKRGKADLSKISMKLAVEVAAQVVGLTDSRIPGMGARISSMVETPDNKNFFQVLAARWNLLAFFFFDVRPSIAARKKQPREDVISHVLSEGYTPPEVLSECVTYGAAGMATTREFICAAVMHFLERPKMRTRFLVAGEVERHAMLGEILRLEPVVTMLERRTTDNLEIESEGQTVTIPKGAKIAVHLNSANADERTVGTCPHDLRTDRELPKGVQPAVMGFGDGHHRCPGSFIAIQETDIFLQRLLALPTLRVERPATLGWNDTVKGYELRNFILAV